MKKKKVLITGITGQDGSYLAELLLFKGYEVHGLVRRVAIEDQRYRFYRINHLKDRLILHTGNLESYSRIVEIVDKIKPDECYHLGAQSFVASSFDDSFSTLKINIDGTHHVLAALLQKSPHCKFYYAGSSEMFGKVNKAPQDENTKFHPRSPYGISKTTGYYLTQNYREAYNMFACGGILFNHESPRRGKEFVTRKITSTIAGIKRGSDNVLILGNLDAKRDWGYAPDYVVSMWKMLQQKIPDDYVIATGKNHSISDFINIALKYAQLDGYKIIDLRGLNITEANNKLNELRKYKNDIFVVQHPEFFRPAEVNELIGNAAKARNVLGWQPSVDFENLVKIMVEYDIKILK